MPGPDLTAPLELLIVEDHPAVRRGLTLLLSDAGFRIAGTAGSVSEARGLLERRRYDVALVDIVLSDGSAIDLLRETLEEDPDAPIVVYTGGGDPGSLRAAMTTGVRGLVLKSATPALLAEALETVARGGAFVDPDIAGGLAASPAAARWSALSTREKEVIELLSEGLTGQQIAQRLALSPETIKAHVRNARHRLGATTRAHAVALAFRARDASPAGQ